MASEVTYDDMTGFRLWGHHKAFLWLVGRRPNALGPMPTDVRIRKYTLGLMGLLLCFSLLVASFNGGRVNLGRKNLNNVAKNLVVCSTCISAIHKFCIFSNQAKGITRITLWMKKVKARGEQPSAVEVFLRRSLRIFYIGGSLAPWVIFMRPLLQGENYAYEYPYIDHSQEYLILPVILAGHWVVAFEVTFDAACLVNMLITYRSELLRLESRWSSMGSGANENSFGDQLKQNVDEHAELLMIFKDLKNFNNSMFGYQVFATTFTASATIYGFSKDAQFLHEAASQMLPVFFAAVLEFALLCWLGEEITSGFFQFHRAVHMTNWYEAELRHKRSLTVILEFTQHPKILTGFTTFEATLSTFVETMRQSFSLYTLLKAIG